MLTGSQEGKLPAIGGTSASQRKVVAGDERRALSRDQGRVTGAASIEEGRSPFKQPTEDEIFYYRDKEHERIQEGKKNSKNLKIWDKKTGSTKNPLKNFKHFGHPMPKKTEGEQQVTTGGKKAAEKAENTLLTEATSIVMERKKQRDNLKHHARNRETMADVVAQKKEIFLVTMTTKIIKEETEKLKQLIDGKKTALNQ